MAYLRTAVNVPVPVTNTSLNQLLDAENSTGLNGAQVLRAIEQGTYNLCSPFNRNALSIELLGRKGCGTYCVLYGCGFATSASLNLTIAKGQVYCDGVVEIGTVSGSSLLDKTYAVPASQTDVYIWAKQDGTITHSLTTSPPTGGKVYLGWCSTSGSAVTAVDFSGVMYTMGSIALRNTADTGTPGDTPPATLTFLTQTSVGTYLWNGTAYTLIQTPAQLIEYIQDVVGALAAGGNGVDVTYSDAGPSLTFDVNITEVVTLLNSQQLPNPYYSAALSATLELTLASQNVIAVSASGANRTVELPASPTWGTWFRIMNIGSANNILVKDSTGTTTIATLTPGDYIEAFPVTDAGVAEWPSSITPIAMGGPL